MPPTPRRRALDETSGMAFRFFRSATPLDSTGELHLHPRLQHDRTDSTVPYHAIRFVSRRPDTAHRTPLAPTSPPLRSKCAVYEHCFTRSRRQPSQHGSSPPTAARPAPNARARSRPSTSVPSARAAPRSSKSPKLRQPLPSLPFPLSASLQVTVAGSVESLLCNGCGFRSTSNFRSTRVGGEGSLRA